MNFVTYRQSILGVMTAAFLLCVFSAQAFADKRNPELLHKKKPNTLSLMLGKAEMIDLNGAVADVLVADPNVADVMAVKSNRLYVVGSALGDTNIIALDASGDVIRKINVHVQMDTEKLSEMIDELYPDENVRVRALTDQVVLTGDVSTPAVASKITSLVANYAGEIQGLTSDQADNIIVNMLSVAGERQVMLKVKIVEASRNALKELGLEGGTLNAGGNDFGLNAGTAAALGLSNPTQLGVAALNYSSGTFGDLTYIARALEQKGVINTLAEPNLTAISGEQAGFLAGGEFPIPTSLDQNGNVIIAFKPFGVSLNFRPIVMSRDRISLQINTEVSTVSFDQNLQLNNLNVPNFNVRRADTTVEMASGGTLMIAGLIQSESISGLTQLPGVGDVPVVGDLVKSDSFRRDESEVIVMITPYLVEPFAQNHAAITPSGLPTGVIEGNEFKGGYIHKETPDLKPRAKPMEQSQFDDIGLNKVTLNEGKLTAQEVTPHRLPLPAAPVESQALAPIKSAQVKSTHNLKTKSVTNSSIFSDNIKRLYGKNAPTTMLDQTVGFGYMME